jgi:hypothetical protein
MHVCLCACVRALWHACTQINEVDTLAAAAAGLTTGWVCATPHRPDSPTSPLDGEGSEGVEPGGEGSVAGGRGFGTGPEGLFTHRGTLDVEAVEVRGAPGAAARVDGCGFGVAVAGERRRACGRQRAWAGWLRRVRGW